MPDSDRSLLWSMLCPILRPTSPSWCRAPAGPRRGPPCCCSCSFLFSVFYVDEGECPCATQVVPERRFHGRPKDIGYAELVFVVLGTTPVTVQPNMRALVLATHDSSTPRWFAHHRICFRWCLPPIWYDKQDRILDIQTDVRHSGTSCSSAQPFLGRYPVLRYGPCSLHSYGCSGCLVVRTVCCVRVHKPPNTPQVTESVSGDGRP